MGPLTQQPTKLARAAAGGTTQATPETKLARSWSGSKVRVPWRIPRLELDVEITLVGHRDQERIEAEVWAHMRKLELPPNTITESAYEAARAVRWFAVAFLEPGTDKPIGTLDDWQSIDADVIAACWRRMADVREMHDPVGAALTPEDVQTIGAAVKKKDPMTLRFFGVAALASYLLTLDEQQPTSASVKSSPSQSYGEI